MCTVPRMQLQVMQPLDPVPQIAAETTLGNVPSSVAAVSGEQPTSEKSGLENRRSGIGRKCGR